MMINFRKFVPTVSNWIKEVKFSMKLLTLLIVGIGWLLLISWLKIQLKINYNYLASGSKLFVEFKLFFSRLQIELNIPQDMLSSGIWDALHNVMQDITEDNEDHHQQKAESSKSPTEKKKAKRYKVFKNTIREFIRHYIFSWARFLWVYQEFTRLKRYFFRRVNVHSFHALVEIGGKEAGATGLLTGACWFFFGQLTARLYRTVTVKSHNFSYRVIPNFEKQTFLCRFNCILSLKICHIIFTAYKFLLFIIKNRRISNYGRAPD
jgi:hypothetical protein